MGLLSPLFLIGALAAAVPIVLHLRKRHPDAIVRFSAVRLLKHAPVEHASRRHLRELLLLALRVGALVLCALAFARPFFASSSADGGSAVVIAIDTSFSMSGAGRFERTRALAIEAIDRAGTGDQVGVVTFNDTAQVGAALSSDRALARAAIGATQPTLNATRYRGAIAAASDLLRGRSGRIVVVTDLQQSGWNAGDRPIMPASVRLEVVDIGLQAANLAVTSTRLAGDRIAATIKNMSVQSADARVHLVVGAAAGASDGQPAGDVQVPIAAGQSAEVTFPKPVGRWAAVSVDDPAGAAADNVRYLVFDGESRSRVLVITATGELNHEAFYLEQALMAGAGRAAATYQAIGVAGSALQSWDQPRLDPYAAIVLCSTRGLDHHGRELIGRYVQKGGGLLAAASTDLDGEVLSEALGGARLAIVAPASGPAQTRTLAPVDGRHPVMRPFSGQASLGVVRFERVATIRAEGCAPLARFSSGEAALLECESGAGRALLFASDLDNRGNDFPLHATFLPFVHEAVRYLAGNRRAAEYFVGTVPTGIPAIPGVAAAPGLEAGDAALVAVNVDPAESDPTRLTMQEFQDAVGRAGTTSDVAPRALASEQEAQQHLWQYMLAAMLAVLAVEGVVSMRAS